MALESTFIRYNDTISSLVIYRSNAGSKVILDLQKELVNIPFAYILGMCLCSFFYFLLKLLKEFTNEAIRDWASVCGNIFNNKSTTYRNSDFLLPLTSCSISCVHGLRICPFWNTWLAQSEEHWSRGLEFEPRVGHRDYLKINKL